MLFKKIKIKLRQVKKTLSTYFLSLGKKRILILGDSHAKVFEYMNSVKPNANYYFDVVSVGGATALGMVNPNSKTNCLKIFREKLNRVPQNTKIIMLLGEVDTGFVIWYRADKYGMTIEDQMNDSLNNYFKFVDNLKEDGFTSIALMSAPLPTIKDNHEKFGEIPRLRKAVKSSIQSRTQLTLEYNSQLNKYCDKEKMNYLDLDKYLLGNDNLISSVFLNKNPLDHHCDNEAYSEVIFSELENKNMLIG